MPDENREQNGNPTDSEAGTQIYGDFSTADRTLIQTEERENNPTQILSGNETAIDEETAPTAKRYGWHFAIVSFVYALMLVNTGVSISQIDLTRPEGPFFVRLDGESLKISLVRQYNEGTVRGGDELISINGQEVRSFGQFHQVVVPLKAGERITVVVRRDGELRLFEFILEPLSLPYQIYLFLGVTLYPTAFILAGLLVFLFKPNDQQSFLFALMFALCAQVPGVLESLPLLLKIIAVLGLAAQSFFAVIALHFFLIFPERSPLIRRFSRIEYLIYVPTLCILLPGALMTALNLAGWRETINFNPQSWFYSLTIVVFLLYCCAGLFVLFLSYYNATAAVRRKLSVVVGVVSLGVIPALLLIIWSNFLSPALEIELPHEDWTNLSALLLALLIPLGFAYAIVRHQVIPVSFIIRRGLQYLLAKNALRLFLILPVVGIIWSIAANPNRTVYDILLNNSFSFYFFVALAVVDGILLRSRLSVWIDRQFFREQYNQERILRGLTESVKESDSMSKLSRLVSSKIQTALHPSSVYLFYQEEQQSDFSLGYSTTETSANMKLSVDSPLLRFMQKQKESVNFPFGKEDGLPPAEKRWLKQIGANLLVPMHGTDGKLAGFFSLGEKLSEIPYTSRDRELLETLANQVALVHENLSLKDRVRREQQIKTEVLSRFDAGNINLLKECERCGRCYDRTETVCTDDNTELTISLPVERTIENRYRLEKLLGKGGMGAVYEATDLRINRRVAVKILSGAMFGNREALRRFEREAQTAGRLQHRNIVTIFDYGVLSTEGAFLVMELVRGESLRDVFKLEGKLDFEIIRAWFEQILDGVEAAHKSGIVHRDLKPDNIIVAKNEGGEARLCILDFGLARADGLEFAQAGVTVPGTVMGTFGYMPPEQLRGERTNERSDLFSIAVMIYEAIHGKRPFRGRNYHELLRAMSDEFVFESDEPLAEFFEQGLAREPENRFASAAKMKQDLSAAIVKPKK